MTPYDDDEKLINFIFDIMYFILMFKADLSSLVYFVQSIVVEERESLIK